jgi:hypothetical protein
MKSISPQPNKLTKKQHSVPVTVEPVLLYGIMGCVATAIIVWIAVRFENWHSVSATRGNATPYVMSVCKTPTN